MAYLIYEPTQKNYIAKFDDALIDFKYSLMLTKNKLGNYEIFYEKLSSKKATSKKAIMETIFDVANGEIKSLWGKEENLFSKIIVHKTLNLLTNTSMCALFYEKILASEQLKNIKYKNMLFSSLLALFIFGERLHVYLDSSDDHREYFVKNSLQYVSEVKDKSTDSILNDFVKTDVDYLNVITVTKQI